MAALFLLLSSISMASTLSPDHPLWKRGDLDRQSFLRSFQEQKLRHSKGLATERLSSDFLQKGFGAHGLNILILPVLFQDSGENPPYSQEQMQDRYLDAAQEGTLSGYYDFVSGGKFSPEGMVLPWLRLSGEAASYANVIYGRYTNDGGCRAMVTEAVRMADRLVDLSYFDSDGPDGLPGSGDDDGRIDLLVVLHPDPGFESLLSSEGTSILAHQGRVAADEIMQATGIMADAYVVASAKGPIGVLVHEFGHLLGLEDLYDVDVSGSLLDQPFRGGLGVWSLMSHGTWGGGGEKPSHLDPISRRILGWEEEQSLETNGFEILDAVSRGGSSLEILPFGNWASERFILEARKKRIDGVVDGDLPGSGVLVYRVDDRYPLNEATEGYWISLLQADGDSDLESLVNNGDAGDPFTGLPGADLLASETVPSSASHQPDASKIAPRIEISEPMSDSSQIIELILSDIPALSLSYALLRDPVRGDRAHLIPGETVVWDLRFHDLSGSISTGSVEVFCDELLLEVEPAGAVELIQDAAGWIPTEPITFTLPSSVGDLESIPVSLRIQAGSEAPRFIDLEFPVSLLDGILAEDFQRWIPRVLQAVSDSTRFLSLGIQDLPLPTESGWALFTDDEEGYASGVELELCSPWFAADAGMAFRFWSRQVSETSQPGEAYDGGVIEYLDLERGWLPLVPRIGETTLIVHRSSAATRGLVGLGGSAVDWSQYEVELPRCVGPTRLRFRFASDATIATGSWALAGAGGTMDYGKAELSFEVDRQGMIWGDARIQGDLPGISTVRFRYRRPLDEIWLSASPILTFSADLPVVSSLLDLPAGEDILQIALFAEVIGGATPALLLGQSGFRRPQTDSISLQTLRNPASGIVEIRVASSDENLEFGIFDTMGRRVHKISLPAAMGILQWDGKDSGGDRVAAGVYTFVCMQHPDLKISVVYFP